MRFFRIALTGAIAFCGIVGVLAGIVEASPVSANSAPSSIDDGVESSTQVGSGLFSQSLLMSRHFFRPRNFSEMFMNKKRLEQETDQLRPEEPSEFSWSLGYGFTRFTYAPTSIDPEIFNDLHVIQLGSNWDLQKELKLSAQVLLDYSPQENYRSGHIQLRAEYMLSFDPSDEASKKKREFRKAHESEAIHYYEKELDSYRPESKAPRSNDGVEAVYFEGDNEEDSRALDLDPYPNVRLAAGLGVSRHQKDPEQVKRTVRGTDAPGATFLNELMFTPEVIFSPDEQWSLRAAGSIHLYTSPAATFVDYFAEAGRVQVPLLITGGIGSHASRVLAFRTWSLEQGVEIEVGEVGTFELTVQEAFYVRPDQAMTIAVNPLFYRSFGKHWRGGLSVATTISGGAFLAAGGLDLIYYF